MSSEFPCMTPRMERFSLDLTRENVLKNRECALKFVIAGRSKVGFFDFYNLKLQQIMSNITGGNQ